MQITTTLLARLWVCDSSVTAPSTPDPLTFSDVNLRRSLLKFARMSDPPITFSLPAQVVLFT